MLNFLDALSSAATVEWRKKEEPKIFFFLSTHDLEMEIDLLATLFSRPSPGI